ncbi:dTDP-glucose 4,6-dehydratase [Bilophila wadsworthia]|jgi:dTDP-glucose 4,6-dehydratase|uniref:dTDP-glucose 4,6-dehydratase n=1 Tax=Bilophila wadsworthia TaxID=35833 RepID=UPI00266D328E|nr:dTDP-glucose 4,6-dehydratase [Bilophila wadsworthia]
MQTLLVTGGAGFIGSCYVLKRCAAGDTVINLDKLTYSGNPDNLFPLRDNPRHIFVEGDIGNAELVAYLLQTYRPNAVVNFAAESHVDRSILDPDAFVRTNVFGTCSLLRTVKDGWTLLTPFEKAAFRFLHVSTDEVFGALNPGDPAFTEETPYNPNSPYSASKASSDHFVRAFHETYGLPTLITNCSNNYGPRQFPEKLIPLVTLNALARKSLPVYGSGSNVRDWLHVEDHCSAIQRVLESGRAGQTYNIGGNSERTNLQVVHGICEVLDQVHPSPEGSYASLIKFVKDRPGHDFRYAINCSKIKFELGWKPDHTFEEGLRETVLWYLANSEWVEHVQSGAYRDWIRSNYAERM